ncbi:MAG: SiaB family protein kinase [Bacteroides sp.]|jgi:hypothetical protein|nr:SiaB family protein kinase [Bacteroides sp.]
MRHLETFREVFSQGAAGQLLLAFNGAFTQENIVNLASAVRNEVENLSDPVTGKRAFSIFVEMAQNVLHYSQTKGSTGKGAGRFLLFQNPEGFHLLTVNLIDPSQMDYLKRRIAEINRMGTSELRSIYLTRRRQKDTNGTGGAGLGLMDISRRSGSPLGIGFLPEGQGRLSFYLRATLNKKSN